MGEEPRLHLAGRPTAGPARVSGGALEGRHQLISASELSSVTLGFGTCLPAVGSVTHLSTDEDPGSPGHREMKLQSQVKPRSPQAHSVRSPA